MTAVHAYDAHDYLAQAELKVLAVVEEAEKLTITVMELVAFNQRLLAENESLKVALRGLLQENLTLKGISHV